MIILKVKKRLIFIILGKIKKLLYNIMPPKKMKKSKRKTKTKPTTSNINKQVVIINQPVKTKRKYTRRKSTPQQPFSTPESSIGQVFNLLRFIPQQPPRNYENQPKPPPILLGNQPYNQDNRQHNYDDYEDIDKMSSVSGSTRDFSDITSVSRFKDDKRPSHKPDILTPVSEEKAESQKAESEASSSSSSEEEDVKSDTSSKSASSVKSDTSSGSVSSVKSVVGGGGGGGVKSPKIEKPLKIEKTPEFKRRELIYREWKYKLDNYKGNNPNTLKTYQSQLNSARFDYNYERGQIGLERITDEYD